MGKRLTNKVLIEDLLPRLKQFYKEFKENRNSFKFTKNPHYDFLWYKKEVYENDVRYLYVIEDREDFYLMDVSRELPKNSKFEFATVLLRIYKKDFDIYYSKHHKRYICGYQKEWKGLGNGFYADLDFETGKILFSEWD